MIRFYEEKDIPFIYELGSQLSSNFKDTNNLKELGNYTKIIVYEEENIIKGFLMYTDLEQTVDICNIFVSKEYRRNHIATYLLDFMFDELSEEIKLLTLEVRKSNESAIALYQKFGFETMHIRKNYYQNEDAYLMGRRMNE